MDREAGASRAAAAVAVAETRQRRTGGVLSELTSAETGHQLGRLTFGRVEGLEAQAQTRRRKGMKLMQTSEVFDRC